MKTRFHIAALLALLTLFGAVQETFGFYCPLTGRWLSKDPIGENGGPNLYAFCINDPVNLIDPFGEDFITIGSNAAISGVPAEIGGHMSIIYWKDDNYCIQEKDQKRGGVSSGTWQRPGGAPRGAGYTTIATNARFSEVIELHFESDFETTYSSTGIRGGNYQHHDRVALSRVQDRKDTDNADFFVVLYADSASHKDAAQKWKTIVGAANGYAYAEHGPFSLGQKAVNWPNSLYGNLIGGNSNNSNTFIRYLANSIGKSADITPGRSFPGNTTPQAVNDTRPIPTYVGP